MNKFVRIGLVLSSVACGFMGWLWVVTFEPTSPLVPFILLFMSGGIFHQSLQD